MNSVRVHGQCMQLYIGHARTCSTSALMCGPSDTGIVDGTTDNSIALHEAIAGKSCDGRESHVKHTHPHMSHPTNATQHSCGDLHS